MDNWYYLNQGATVGPLTQQAMESMIRAGTLRPETMVWPGVGEWVAASGSPLAANFGGTPLVSGYAPPPPPNYIPNFGAPAKKSWLPENKGARMALLVLVVLIGAYAMWSGLQEIGVGLGMGGDNPDARINITGCRGTGPSAVQCGYQNVGTVKGRVCFDIVIACADGRHVASTCSDEMEPGQGSTQQVDRFKPTIQPTIQCSGMTYENAKART